jgi:D-xylose 1-dehydrogenase (NADP+, D-xylono-1,5-lactone-forming)
MDSDRPLRIGILGAARIARLFVEAVRPSTRVEVRSIASRDIERAKSFAAELGIPETHASYDALLADTGIDAIYNPLPNNLHAMWSVRAADAGKHVLCEKPLAMSAREADAIFAAAGKNNVFVVEGYPYRAQPQTLKLRELLGQGVIGRIQTIQASFGFLLTDAANIRFNPDLGGGALMDAGSYPVSFVRMAAGERPRRASAMARWAESGVDLTLMGSIEFESGPLAQIACSFATARHRQALIVGDQGTISTTYYNDTSAAFPPTLELRRGTGWDAQRQIVETAATSGFLAEADAFADLVAYGWERWKGTTPDESIDIMSILDAMNASAHGAGIVDISH